MEIPKYKTTERKFEIMQYLCRNRFTTMNFLAQKYGVTTRTVKRDIDELGTIIPIVTQQGRFGGVGVMDGYYWDKAYMSDGDIDLLKDIQKSAKSGKGFRLDRENISRLERLIKTYEKPKS